jgi:predicted Ser/Thr protein kinase
LSVHGAPPLESGSESPQRKPGGETSQLKLGRYEVVRELGKGAMGIVYLAKDPLIGRLVALKTIRPAAHVEDDETKEFQQRFIREAQAAGILNHPAIVTVFDIGQDEASGVNFIAMEYVEGQNLKEVLAQGRALTWEQIGELIAQIAEALDFAHSKGIVHRDVKPANIILLDGNRAKIMDFGIAKIASGAGNLTSTGQFLGTPNYMAPEQIKGAPVDGRTDLFALGICLYESLTRRKPFGGDSLTSISYKIVHEPFPPLHEINPQIPEGFEEVVANCLAKEPGRRYQRGRELALALRAVARGDRPARRDEPLLNDETVLTEGRDRIPTIDMPFPDAAGADDVSTQAAKGMMPAAAVGTGGRARAARSPVVEKFSETLTRVKAMPAWRRVIPYPVATLIILLLVGGLAATVVAIRKRQPPIPKVDAQAEAQRQRERQLRTEGNELLAQGRVAEAYARFEELSRIAPNSPAVTVLLQKLAAMRTQEEIGRAQIILAKQKLDEGIKLYNEKKYIEAVPVLQTAFSLNPSDPDAVNYLRLAQLEEQKIEAAKLQRQIVAAGGTVTGTAGRTTTAPRTVSQAPAQLVTVFNHPFVDGYMIVKAGADTVVQENLWTESGRFFRRKTPRPIQVTREVIPKNTDVDIWVIVKSMNINEHRRIPYNFKPGSSQRLQISYNAQSKTFDYQLH